MAVGTVRLRSHGRRPDEGATARTTCGDPPGTEDDRGPAERPDDASWVDAQPFRVHLRFLMAAGALDAAEVAVVTGLSTSAVCSLLDGRHGRPARRISPGTARRVLRVSATEVRGLRWSVTPPTPALAARTRLLAAGWSVADVAATVGFTLEDVAALGRAPHCNRLLSVRLEGLARRLPGTADDRDLPTIAAGLAAA